MRTLAVFDIDGCLADTLPLVLDCYRRAGAREATLEDVRRNWRLWLPDMVGGEVNAERVRHRKTQFYTSRLRHDDLRILPAARLAQELFRRGDEVYAVTAGGRAAANAVLSNIGLAHVPILSTELLPEVRSEFLEGLAPRGTYYDDDRETIERVHEETEWTAIRVGV